MKEMPPILKFTNLESSTLEKGFLCTFDRFFVIGGSYLFYSTFSISNRFEDWFTPVSLMYHLSLIMIKI